MADCNALLIGAESKVLQGLVDLFTCPEQARGVGWLRIELVELLSLTPAQQIFLLAKVNLP